MQFPFAACGESALLLFLYFSGDLVLADLLPVNTTQFYPPHSGAGHPSFLML